MAKTRVCNSDDPPDAAELGVCREPEFDYLDVRAYPKDWESVIFEAWLIQIVLSELLGVPASIENASPESELNFYHPENAFKYGPGTDGSALPLTTALLRAYDLGGDCTLANRDPEAYETCSHVSPEVWSRSAQNIEHFYSGKIEFPGFMGVLGSENWFVTKFTADKHPEVVSHLGLKGEENRQKLAELFLRPTSWKDYCEQVSPDLCESDDGVAKRAPVDENEGKTFFLEGSYTGHFRKTEENDCDTNPTNCTGHIGDFPCGWQSFVEAQCHHLGMALRSSGDQPGSRGYSYSRLVEMWKAANATKSNLLMMWWTPEALYQSFAGTDAAFLKVNMPPATQECVENRVNYTERCEEDPAIRVGSPKGVCDDSAKPLEKYISGGLFPAIYDSSIPEALRNPGHSVLDQFSITALQLNEIFDLSREKGSMREAVCEWASENMEYLNTLVPRAYPRVQLEKEHHSGLLIAATIMGGLSMFLVMVTGWKVHSRRNKRAMRLAQLEFLWILLAGLFFISVGAIVQGVNPTNAACVASRWLVNIGYTMELVPLIIKVGAINLLMNSAKSFRRVTVTRKNLFGAVAAVGFIVVTYLIVWTVLDPPQRVPEYRLTEGVTADGETVVDKTYYCSSDSDLWGYIAVGWNSVLLLCATVLAFQTRKIQKDFNESQTLAIMIYSHFVFLVMRIVTFALSGDISDSILNQVQSILFSVDTMVTLAVYFVPKLTWKEDTRPSYSFSVTLQRDDAEIEDKIGDLSSGQSRSKKGELSSGLRHRQPCPKCGWEDGSDDIVHEDVESKTSPSREPSTAQVSTEKTISPEESCSEKDHHEDMPSANFLEMQDMSSSKEEQPEAQSESFTPLKESLGASSCATVEA
jgi:hypothetical protein